MASTADAAAAVSNGVPAIPNWADAEEADAAEAAVAIAKQSEEEANRLESLLTSLNTAIEEVEKQSANLVKAFVDVRVDEAFADKFMPVEAAFKRIANQLPPLRAVIANKIRDAGNEERERFLALQAQLAESKQRLVMFGDAQRVVSGVVVAKQVSPVAMPSWPKQTHDYRRVQKVDKADKKWEVSPESVVTNICAIVGCGKAPQHGVTQGVMTSIMKARQSSVNFYGNLPEPERFAAWIGWVNDELAPGKVLEAGTYNRLGVILCDGCRRRFQPPRAN